MKDEIKEIRDYIACPQLGDDYYGEWGALRLDQRLKIKSLLDYITNLQAIEQEHQRINGELREENKRLRETNKIFSERIISENNPDYKDRCDKVLDSVNGIYVNGDKE